MNEVNLEFKCNTPYNTVKSCKFHTRPEGAYGITKCIYATFEGLQAYCNNEDARLDAARSV